MRTEAANHATERVKRKTQPRYIARFFHVPEYGSADEYAFSVDFCSGAITSPTVDKLQMIEDITGAFAQVFPEQGRASLGSIRLVLTDAADLALAYLGRCDATLASAITAGSPGAGADLFFAETVSNLPPEGTLEVTTGGVIERIRYTAFAGPDDHVEVVARGVDGTTAASHATGDPITNGEQIRPGQRCQIYAGYAGLAEADFMKFSKMEVVERRLHEDGAGFVVELADIQRTLRREIFLTAAPDAPIAFDGIALDLVLIILHSTGTGTNGPYDLLPASCGLGLPAAYIDAVGIAATSALVAQPHLEFTIRAPVVAKDWIEQELLQPLNCYPIITQEGKYSVRRFGGYRG